MSKKPVHEVRLGRIKAAIWENETQNGTLPQRDVVASVQGRRPVEGLHAASAATTCPWWPRSPTCATPGSSSRSRKTTAGSGRRTSQGSSSEASLHHRASLFVWLLRWQAAEVAATLARRKPSSGTAQRIAGASWTAGGARFGTPSEGHLATAIRSTVRELHGRANLCHDWPPMSRPLFSPTLDSQVA